MRQKRSPRCLFPPRCMRQTVCLMRVRRSVLDPTRCNRESETSPAIKLAASKMSNLHKTLFCLLVLALAIAFSFGGYTVTKNQVIVPIEVLGGDGHTETITVNATDVSNVDRIWFNTYSQGDPLTRDLTPKAQISVNGGPWIDVANDNPAISCPWLEDFYGCVEGVSWTTRWTLNVDDAGVDLQNGDNTITFRLNSDLGQIEGSKANISSGYYVLGMAFLNTGDPEPRARAYTKSGAPGGDPDDWMSAGAIDGTVFQWWDPMNDPGFGIPEGLNTSGDISAGRQLWNDRNALIDHPGGPQIKASCADCHASNGDDLQTFAFSNKSIVARAEFHGLNQKQGRQIAAYIRSIHSRDEIVAKGPWQPPYQPGPTISSFNPDCDGLHPDEAPEKCWAAGAGVEWVLEKDEQLKQYLFPNGLSGSAATDVTSTLNTLNLREMPVALQFPDWNEWLPRVHPIDANGWSQSDFENHGTSEYYTSGRVEEAWQTAESNLSKSWKATNVMRNWNSELKDFQRTYIDKYDDTDAGKLGIRQWKAVKTWEVMRGREGYGPSFYSLDIVDVNGDLIKTIKGEPRTWVGSDRTLFNVAPHINKAGIYGPDQTVEDQYMDTVWYDLQMVLNSGNRDAIVIRPMDWKYHLQHVRGMERAANNSGKSYVEPYRYLRSYIKQNQQLDTGDQPEDRDSGLGDWHWRHTSHRWLTTGNGPDGDKTPIDNLPTDERRKILTAVLTSYMDRIERVPVDSDGYNCGVVGGNCRWERSESNNDLEPADVVPSTDGFHENSNYVEHFYLGTRWLEDLGTEPRVLGRMYDWASKMWPKGNDTGIMGTNPTWDSLNPCRSPNKTSACTAATVNEHKIQLKAGWNLISSRIKPDNPGLKSVFSNVIEDVVLLKNERGETFIPSYSINTIGDWSWDESYMLYMTQDRTLTVQGDVIGASTSMTLDEGWNLVPYFPESSMPVGDAFAGLGSNLVIVKDYAGNSYIPEYGINDIGTLEPGQGYKVYVETSASMSYPSSKTLASTSLAKTSGSRGVSASATLVIGTSQMENGTTLVARTDDGTQVGQGTVQAGKAAITIAGDDPLTESIQEGASRGARLTVVSTGPSGEQPIKVRGVTNVLTGNKSSGAPTYAKDAILVADAVTQPVSFELKGNAPNPVQTTTSIAFSVPEPTPVRVELYNVLGQRVATLVDDDYTRGTHSVDVNASGYASGVYFYRIEAGDFRKTRKMTIIR